MAFPRVFRTSYERWSSGLPLIEREAEIVSGELRLRAILGVPDHAQAVVLFAHGSGSGRISPRNNAVARALNAAGLATVLADLLTEEESHDRHLVFNIPLLASRLLECRVWVERQEATTALPMAYFGASTGAGAALIAAAQRSEGICSVVSRGGRPDLAEGYLELVRAPTLLIVGGRDEKVLELNERAFARLRCVRELTIIPGATHLFEEPGALEEVSRLARHWFVRHLSL